MSRHQADGRHNLEPSPRSAGTSLRVRTLQAIGAAGLMAVPVIVASVTGGAGAAATRHSIDNWYVKEGTSMASVAAPGGAQAFRITNDGGAVATAVLNDKVNSFHRTVKGEAYTVDADVRTTDATGTSIGLREMEYRGSQKVNEAQSSVWLRDSSWHHLRTRYVARSSGAQIDVNALAWALPAGKSVDVGNIKLTSSQNDGTDPTAPPSAPAPTKPAPTQPAPTQPAPPTQDPGSGDAPSGYHMVWSDEFNGSSVDHNNWNVQDLSTYGDGNKELACLMDRPQNVSENGGMLHIQAQRESTPLKCGSDSRFPNGRPYSSGMLDSQGKKSFKYGYFEIRAKLPTEGGASQGLWPAFWMRPESGSLGELDVLEAIGTGSQNAAEADKVSQTIWYDYNGTYPKQATAASPPTGTPSDGYHTYGIRWAPGVMEWSIDGKVTFTRTSATTPWLDKAFGQPFYFRLNLAVGGTWPGAPTSSTKLPAGYDVDYIRAYQQ